TPSPVPTQAPPTPTPTVRPQPIEGLYARTIADNVPVRVNPNIHAAPTQDVLMNGQIVYVFTQVYDDEGRPWHLIQYNNRYGYILAATTRFLTGAEQQAHINSMATPAPTPVFTPQPVTPSTLSSYGTIKSNNVNLRASASTTSNRLRSLNSGALVLILGTSTGSDGYTWYRVDVQGTMGFIRGDFVNHMTISQYNDYIRNLQNQVSGGGTGGGGSGSGGTGGNVNITIPSTPQHGNGGLADLIAIEEGWSNNIRDGMPDFGASPLPVETPEPTYTPDPFADPDDLFSTPPPVTITDEDRSGGSPVLLLVLGVVLMGGAAGVFGYVQYQNNKRKAEAKNAAARTQAQQGQRRAVTQPIPRDGSASGTSTIMGNAGRMPPPPGGIGGTGRMPPVGGAAGAAGMAGAASQAQRRPQGQPPAKTQPGAPPRQPGQQAQPNPYARPVQQPDPNQPQRRTRAQDPQNKPAPPTRPRDEDLDV
ncbi:MAG: SH3 domain-containing protein, partial [Clostridia bacterium]|nr:SH3 domain-containing protein [Clostridia bacterium]